MLTGGPDDRNTNRPPPAGVQTQKIRSPLRYSSWIDGHLHRRTERQRPALSRLRYQGPRRYCDYEEVAYLLVYGNLPNAADLAAYKARLRPLRTLPVEVKQALELLPSTTHPMDVLRTAVSVLGCLQPENVDHGEDAARGNRGYSAGVVEPHASLLVPFRPPRLAH